VRRALAVRSAWLERACTTMRTMATIGDSQQRMTKPMVSLSSPTGL